MPSEDIGHKKADIPEKQSNVPVDSFVQSTPEAKAPEERAPDSDKKKEPSERSKLLLSLSVLFNALLFIATCTYTFFSYNQWKVMEKQTFAAFQQLSTAKGNIRIANDALDDNRKNDIEQSAKSERLIKVNEIIAQTSIQSANTAKQAAEKYLDATINNFHLEQRAWVGISKISPAKYTENGKKVYIKEGQPIEGGVVIANSGKSPARNVHAIMTLHCLKVGDPLLINSNNAVPMEPSNTLIQPGGEIYLSPAPLSFIPNKASVDDFRNGKIILYITAFATYEDIFKNSHFTEFCAVLQPDLSTFGSCNDHNGAN